MVHAMSLVLDPAASPAALWAVLLEGSRLQGCLDILG